MMRYGTLGTITVAVLSCSLTAVDPPHKTTPAQPDFSPAAACLRAAIERRAFPGCAVAVGTHEGALWIQGFGHLDYSRRLRATPETLYDLASLTKVCATTLVVMRLLQDGKLSLDDPVARYLPAFTGGGRERVTVEHLLTHSSGLPAWRPLYREAGSYEEVVALALKTPLESQPAAKARYSDVGFILLGELAARAGQQSLPELEREYLREPLGLQSTLRHPPPGLLGAVAPTEVREDGTPLRGVVHDENARAAAGNTGHAGLFSNAEDLSRLATEILRAWRGESPLLARDLVRLFTTRRDLPPGSSRAMGWDTPTPGGSAGRHFGPRSFGHTGFTGTSLWIDPEQDLYLILLTNRVHPERKNEQIYEVRRELAERVVRCLRATGR